MAKKKTDRTLKTRQLERILGDDLTEMMKNVIWQSDDGVYEVFARYRIVPVEHLFTVYRDNRLVGEFHATRTALGWCIADKYGRERLAKELLGLDNQLDRVKNDIAARTRAAERSADINFREAVMTKLETKIIRKKQIEFEINKCINTARSCQNQGFNNETTRTSRKASNR